MEGEGRGGMGGCGEGYIFYVEMTLCVLVTY